jgi:hypothetical protein
MSAFRAARVGDHRKHGVVREGRSGAGDEGTGSDLAGDSEEADLVGGGGDHRGQAIGRCDAGGSATSNMDLTDCWIGDAVGPSEKWVPLATVEQVLSLYRDRNVRDQ